MKSLGVRLALLYAAVSTATLAMLFVAGYYLLHQHLVHGLDLLNDAEFQQMKLSLGPDVDRLQAGQIEEHIRRTTEAASVLFYIEVHQRGNGTYFRSANLGGRRIPDAPGLRQWNASVPSLGEMRVGEYFLGASDVTIATSLEQVKRVMEGYAEISLVLICFMLVGSLITGLALSRIALRPVRLIEETANRIRSDNLSERIPVADVQDEVSRLARLLNEMFDRLESAFNQVRRFTAEASHELKTPLSLVRLQAEKLVTEGGLNPTQEEAVQVQLEELERLNKIIEELLFLSRAEAQAIKAELRRDDPQGFLQSFVPDAQVLAEARGVRFRAGISGGGRVDFDPKWIRQVLLNLLSNALKFSPRGGQVTLTSQFTADAWRIEVEDDGPGVPAEERERIFERFVRLKAQPDTDEHGSGLGLAISRSLVALHRGTIQAAPPTRGTGLRVIIEIPIADVQEPAAATT
ncbi:MAG TPA: ATP-binding protein [Opitutaceae bacterium]|nr:ATP-binding protein [Opitutaceae bacterium]